jgi:hypothetical protein
VKYFEDVILGDRRYQQLAQVASTNIRRLLLITALGSITVVNPTPSATTSDPR